MSVGWIYTVTSNEECDRGNGRSLARLDHKELTSILGAPAAMLKAAR